jgi:hypothetical protein
MFVNQESLLIFCLVKDPCLFWDCKGKNLFYFCKTYFLFFCFAFSNPLMNIPLSLLRAAKVSRLLYCASAC